MNSRDRNNIEREGIEALVVLVILALCAIGVLIVDRDSPRKTPSHSGPTLMYHLNAGPGL